MGKLKVALASAPVKTRDIEFNILILKCGSIVTLAFARETMQIPFGKYAVCSQKKNPSHSTEVFCAH